MYKNKKEYRITPLKVLIHLSTIMKHKFYVFMYCLMCGFPLIGITHDLSKFSLTEFFTNIKYIEKGISPIEVQKREFGFSPAWQHHKGHNPHHYEYWMDRFDDGCYVTRMPFRYVVEMLCDYLAANKTYLGRRATFSSEYRWWQNQRDLKNMHPDSKRFLDIVFKSLNDIELNRDLRKPNIRSILNKHYLEYVYNISCSRNTPMQVLIKR